MGPTATNIDRIDHKLDRVTRDQLTVWIIEGDFYVSFNKPAIRCPRREGAKIFA